MTNEMDKGIAKLTDRLLRKMNAGEEHSGFQVLIQLADLAEVKAPEFQWFSLLLR